METRIKTHSKGINSAIQKHAHAGKACEVAFETNLSFEVTFSFANVRRIAATRREIVNH